MVDPLEKVFDELNKQIQRELDAWYAYLGMSNWCSGKYLSGIAKWMNSQAQEEYTHAMKLRRFLVDRSRPVQLKVITEPQNEFDSIVDIFEIALKQEQDNTSHIHRIFQIAFEERAFASVNELQWFVTEQVEEERTAKANLAHIKMVADDPAALLDLDKSFGERETIFPIPE